MTHTAWQRAELK